MADQKNDHEPKGITPDPRPPTRAAEHRDTEHRDTEHRDTVPARQPWRTPTSDRFFGPIGLTDTLEYQVDPEQARRDLEESKRRGRHTPAPGPPYRDRVLGCLLAGAVGDALGAAIEFDSIEDIRRQHGPAGLTDYAPAYGRAGAITDDTQMTLFTLEGLIRAHITQHGSDASGDTDTTQVARAVHEAYLRWLRTQGDHVPDTILTGWLIEQHDLHQNRAPGQTCLTALRATRAGQPTGSIEQPLNNSKGCGAVMRAAPIAFWPTELPAHTFALAAEIGALTHGHPSGYLPAAALAVIIRQLLDGHDLRTAVAQANSELQRTPGGEETLAALRAGWMLARRARPTPETITDQLGGGWTGEQALAIAICAAFSAENLEDGLLLAVNHPGDSDSTGAIAGNILGALHGVHAIPTRWLDQLELRTTIEQLGNDAIAEFSEPPPSQHPWHSRYPVSRH